MNTEDIRERATTFVYKVILEMGDLSYINEQGESLAIDTWVAGYKTAKSETKGLGDQWIEVASGNLPKNRQQVIIFCDPVICNAVYINGDFTNYSVSFGNTQPTHWMPSPPRPKK